MYIHISLKFAHTGIALTGEEVNILLMLIVSSICANFPQRWHVQYKWKVVKV